MAMAKMKTWKLNDVITIKYIEYAGDFLILLVTLSGLFRIECRRVSRQSYTDQAKSPSWQIDTAEPMSLRKTFKKHFAFVTVCLLCNVHSLCSELNLSVSDGPICEPLNK